MRKTLVDKIADGVKKTGKFIAKPLVPLSVAVVSYTGCASFSGGHFPEGHVHDYEFKDKEQTKDPYKLERVILYENQFYAQIRDEKEGTEETLPFVFMPFDKIVREIDLDSGELVLKSKENYVPIKVKVEKYTVDEWADEVALMKETSRKTGIRGVKANILREINERSIYGFSLITTEADATYAIKTTKILGNRYFFPHVSDTNTNEEEKLNFYLIPVKGAKLKIRNSDGGITIRNPNQVYRPVLVKDKEKPKKLEEEITSGQVQEILGSELDSVKVDSIKITQ